MIAKLTTDPIQNDNMITVSPESAPSIHPIPSISFASPSPIHLPFDISHSRANGKASNGPATMLIRDALTNNGPMPVVFIKIETNDMKAYTYTSLSGIILWRIS